jgi:hypothetical protein
MKIEIIALDREAEIRCTARFVQANRGIAGREAARINPMKHAMAVTNNSMHWFIGIVKG